MNKKNKDTFSLKAFGLRRYIKVGTHNYPIDKPEMVEEISVPKEINRIIDSTKKEKDED